jgi:peptidoglycan hydrolase-like protein with peptidoglycan-binding domain
MGTFMFNRTRIMPAVAVPAVAALGFGALATAPAASATPGTTPAPAARTAQIATAASTRLLVVGDHGSDVRNWQQDIDRVAGKINGIPHLATDGAYGPRTAAATRAFQRYAHLSVDGIVGPNTRSAMTTALHGSPTPSAQPILRRGDHGQAVRVWQTDLDNLSTAAGRGGGLGTVLVDGSFGPATEGLTVALQKVEHIAPDGIVGPHTRAAYLTLLASEKKTNG